MNGNSHQNGHSNGNGHLTNGHQSKQNGHHSISETDNEDFKPTFEKTWQYYPAITLAYLVWSVTPISWLMISMAIYRKYQSGFSSLGFFSWTASSNGYSTFPLNLIWYHAILEIPFSIYLTYLNYQAQKKLDPPELDNGLLATLLIQCLEVGTKAHPPRKRDRPEDHHFEEFTVTDEEARLAWTRFRKWFHYAKKSEIKADNVRE